MKRKIFKAYIKVVKFLADKDFIQSTVATEKKIIAVDKKEAKNIVLELYPELFQENKIYERSTKDQAQFFFVTLQDHGEYIEKQELERRWFCFECKRLHEGITNEDKPYKSKFLGEELYFCNSSICYDNFMKKKSNFSSEESCYIKEESFFYIYKITEKKTGKSYIGQTRNYPVWRWWNHLKHSTSPFGLYIQKTDIKDWTFEVLETLDHDTSVSKVLELETKYITEYDSINNGFNSMLSFIK